MATKKISFDPETQGTALRRIVLGILILVGVAFLLNATLMRIDAGHVGIKVKLAGSARGVQDIPVVTGWVMYNPLTEQIVSFPISVQNVVWTASASEGRTVDESITFSSQEGVNVNSDIGLSFHIDSEKAPHLYLRFRQPDVMVLADGYVAYPKINLMEEMANMIQATRGYEANVAAIQASKDMAMGALEIGR